MTEIKHEYHHWIVYVNSNPKFSFMYRKEAEAVSEMIDSLIESTKILEHLKSVETESDLIDEIEQQIEMNKQALKKAGCV